MIQEQLIKIFTSKTRREILLKLKEGEMNTYQLAKDLRKTIPTVRYHVGKLLKANLIKVARIEKVRNIHSKYYSLNSCDPIVLFEHKPKRSPIPPKSGEFLIELSPELKDKGLDEFLELFILDFEKNLNKIFREYKMSKEVRGKITESFFMSLVKAIEKI